MLNSLRSCSTPAAAGEWGGGAVAPSPRACGPPPPSPAGPGLRSGLPRRGRRSRRGWVEFGSLPGCVVGGACCALRGGAVAPAPARAAPARPSRRRRSRLGPVVRPGRPSPRALWAARPRAPPGSPLCAVVGGRAARACVAPAGGSSVPRPVLPGPSGLVAPPGCPPAAPRPALGSARWWSGAVVRLPARASPRRSLPRSGRSSSRARFRVPEFRTCSPALGAWCLSLPGLGLCVPGGTARPGNDGHCRRMTALRALPASLWSSVAAALLRSVLQLAALHLPPRNPGSDFSEVNQIFPARVGRFPRVNNPEIVNCSPGCPSVSGKKAGAFAPASLPSGARLILRLCEPSGRPIACFPAERNKTYVILLR